MIRKVKKELRSRDGNLYFNDDRIDNATTHETIESIKDDCANIYLVYEYVSNYSRVYLASAFDETEAFEQCNFDAEDLQGIELIEWVD